MSVGRLVVVGGSAGALKVLVELAGGLEPSFPAPILVVVHRSAASTSALRQILARATSLPIVEVLDPIEVAPGTVYLAPPDRHLVVQNGAVQPLAGPRENTTARRSTSCSAPPCGSTPRIGGKQKFHGSNAFCCASSAFARRVTCG